MAIDALPTLYPFGEPDTNLAAAVPFDTPQAIPTPAPTNYFAYDGTPMGHGNTCDPISDEMALSGVDMEGYDLMVPDILADNRITWLEDFAMPLLMGVGKWVQSRNIGASLAWAVGSYMAPYPVAAYVAYRAYATQDEGYAPAGSRMSLPPPPKRNLPYTGRRDVDRVKLSVRPPRRR